MCCTLYNISKTNEYRLSLYLIHWNLKLIYFVSQTFSFRFFFFWYCVFSCVVPLRFVWHISERNRFLFIHAHNIYMVSLVRKDAKLKNKIYLFQLIISWLKKFCLLWFKLISIDYFSFFFWYVAIDLATMTV